MRGEGLPSPRRILSAGLVLFGREAGRHLRHMRCTCVSGEHEMNQHKQEYIGSLEIADTQSPAMSEALIAKQRRGMTPRACHVK